MNKLPDVAFVLFDHNGFRHARVCHDPSETPQKPPGAAKWHLAIPHERQSWYEPVSSTEGRYCFRQGWTEAGGDQAKLSAYFGLVSDDNDEVPF